MKKTANILLSLLLMISMALAGCGQSKTEPASESDSLKNAEESLNKDGSYSVAKGDLYSGVNYQFDDGEYWELMTVCKGGKVVDCARNSALMHFMVK